jgi:hypothetical protein
MVNILKLQKINITKVEFRCLESFYLEYMGTGKKCKGKAILVTGHGGP